MVSVSDGDIKMIFIWPVKTYVRTEDDRTSVHTMTGWLARLTCVRRAKLTDSVNRAKTRVGVCTQVKQVNAHFFRPVVHLLEIIF